MTAADFNRLGRELQELLILRYAPIALKLLKTEGDIPPGALRPKRDLGEHLALCQAYGMVRRERKSLVLLREDHWCVWPLIGFGLVEFNEGAAYYDRAVTGNFIENPDKARAFFKSSYPRLDEGSNIGLALAPLDGANFIPDMVLVYLKPAQLRSALMSVKYKSGELLHCALDAVDSCVHSTIPLLKDGQYKITVPDPGEYERGLTDEDEMILSVPAGKLGDLVAGLTLLSERGFGYRQLHMEMKTDFPRPQFYDDLFRRWGLDTGEIWKR
ncbi:Uncharacterized conserved protein, DUF169 family [Sporobacter termitidis DSM 10068]|uniref:Uncharacterized conserved protein, DUF169 family n=1 Tax=Sporobacter termitidis DSM 10068 TaxID=1123282 RepID=A0A1M5ZGN5_9FIRM|nr:DUF169 domain-containing protein [Sporobacter termitidis]SHI23380.1 Uncharacterized conserved protein, DUF169 family [Sporobacter termitidis DSM 10068]